ncbi:MAG TPA: PIN domain nuclease [Methanotrichaceae archaeon]|nr:PIN domain nuclease [Methanotrichaceae archaeon]
MKPSASHAAEGALGSIGREICGVGFGTLEMMRPTGTTTGMAAMALIFASCLWRGRSRPRSPSPARGSLGGPLDVASGPFGVEAQLLLGPRKCGFDPKEAPEPVLLRSETLHLRISVTKLDGMNHHNQISKE